MSIGLDFPFSLSTGSLGYAAVTNDDVAAITANLKSLLLTNWGERPMQPQLGCNLREFLFEPQTRALRAPISDRINSQLKRWMPFLTVESLDVKFSSDDPSIGKNAMRIDLAVRFTINVLIKLSVSLSQ